MGNFTNNSDQLRDLLNNIRNLPGNGTGVQTCTVTITRSGRINEGSIYENFLGDVCYTTVENGVITAKCENVGAGKTITCLCNSLMIIDESSGRYNHEYSGMSMIYNADGNSWVCDIGHLKAFLITAFPNENATLDVELE